MQKNRTTTAKWNEKRQMWVIAVQRDNQRKFFYSSTKGRNGQRECNAKADAWLDEGVENQNIKVNEAFDLYIENLKQCTCKDHYKKYEGYGNNHIKPHIGNKKVIKLNEQDFQDIINYSYSKKHLAKKTLECLRACMTQFVKFCHKKKYTSLFLEDLIIPKGAKKPEHNILQPEQLKILFTEENTILNNVAVKDLYIYAYRFEVLTGLRPGELFGLKWSDIRNGVVHLQRSINKQNEITSGKNDNARRTFKLTPIAQKQLENQRDMLHSLKIQSDYVFCTQWGDNLTQKQYRSRWIRYRDYNNISDSVTPYELRHTFVSIVKSLPEGMIKDMVGHSQNMDTLGTYSHQMTGDMERTAHAVYGIFNNLIFDNESKSVVQSVVN